MPATLPTSLIRVASLAELEAKGVIVNTDADRPIAVFLHDGQVAAVDNRCPHMGFPLHTGTVKDGILTCHWHEARFDLSGGCTFDLWADDVPSYETTVEDGVVYVSPVPRQTEDAAFYRGRLVHGLEHDISLIQAKGILGLRKAGTKPREIVREIARFGAAHHDDWEQGMTILAVVANLAPCLSGETAYRALLRAGQQVASDCQGAAPRRDREPLTESEHSPETLTRWMQSWVRCRHRDGAERVLLTAIEQEGPSPALAELVFTAASDRVYAQTGHVFDFANKAFELLDAIGWEHAAGVLPLVLHRMAVARGAEEDAHWHHPIELIEPLRAAEAELATMRDSKGNGTPLDEDQTAAILLGDDPLWIIAFLKEALLGGVAPSELSKRVAWAAGMRLARFAETNEVADWFGPRHSFIFANAVHRAVGRSCAPGVVRSILHAALSVYMDRFLNVPPAKLPGETGTLDRLPTDANELRAQLLDVLDRRGDVDEAAACASRYLRLGHPPGELFDTLTLATVREDLDFHAIQVLEAAVRQFGEWEGRPQTEQIMIGAVRQLAAFCPTPRAGNQTATIALRLERGDKMYEDDEPLDE